MYGVFECNVALFTVFKCESGICRGYFLWFRYRFGKKNITNPFKNTLKTRPSTLDIFQKP